jgi:hypothetical protein
MTNIPLGGYNTRQEGACGVIMWVKLSAAVAVMAIFVFTVVVVPPRALAQTISCSVDPPSWSIAGVTPGTPVSTFVSGVQGYFTLTNNGEAAEDFTIEGTDAEGSTVTWTLTKTPGSANQYSLGFGQATTTSTSYDTECASYSNFDTSGSDTLIDGLAVDGTFLFDLQLNAYTGTDVSQLMRATVTITAVESSQ